MSFAIILPENWDPPRLVRWAAQFARARNDDLLILQLQSQEGEPRTSHLDLSPQAETSPLIEAIREHASDFVIADEESDSETPATSPTEPKRDSPKSLTVSAKLIQHRDLVTGILKEIADSNVKFLIVPRHRGVKISAAEFAMEQKLLRDVPCEVAQLRPGEHFDEASKSILVACGGGEHTPLALNMAADLATHNETEATAVYVEQDIDPLARLVGHRHAEKIIHRALRSRTEKIVPRAVLDNDVARGIANFAKNHGHHVLLIGAANYSAAQRYLSSSVAEKLVLEATDPTILVVRNAIPLTSRFWRSIDRFKKTFIPQLDRESRVELVDRVQTTSKWNFDFVALICLSTLLASFGLLLNSLPVLIGAMLVAPLMTPMLGAGMSLVQGNRILAYNSIRTVWRGFLLAFFVACLVGLGYWLMYGPYTTFEMETRGSPKVQDLLVAFVSGLVAAYAIGLPNLLSALPGVAIATALVPPIATSGLSVFLGDMDVAIGAALLFLTNFVLIVLGAACSLWASGIRGSREITPFATWARAVALVLFFVAIGLATYFAGHQGRDAKELREAIISQLEQHGDSTLVDISTSYDASGKQLKIVIAQETPVPKSLLQEVSELAKQHVGDATPVRCVAIEGAAQVYRSEE